MSRRSYCNGVSVGIDPQSTSNSNAASKVVIHNVNYPPKESTFANDPEYTGDPKNPYEGVTVVESGKEGKEKERSIETSNQRIEDVMALTTNTDHIIEALSLIIDTYYTNPLIVNKYLLPSNEVLARLILLLTDSDKVDITVDEISCSCIPSMSFTKVSNILCYKGDEMHEFKYSYPTVKKLLDDHHVSIRLLCD